MKPRSIASRASTELGSAEYVQDVQLISSTTSNILGTARDVSVAVDRLLPR